MHATVQEWPTLRAEGVDWIEVGGVRFAGKSVYWLYPEGADWIAGAASFYEDVKGPELVIHPDDTQDERPISWVPDLRHRDVKLGHWWPGTEPDDA